MTDTFSLRCLDQFTLIESQKLGCEFLLASEWKVSRPSRIQHDRHDDPTDQDGREQDDNRRYRPTRETV
jgi:hypothetical protein